MSTSTEFAWTDELAALRDAVRGFCADIGTAPASNERFRRDWRRLGTDLEVLGLAMDEGYGGADAGVLALGVLAEEMGRALISSPLFASVGLMMTALRVLDDDAVNRGVLPALASGEQIGALVIEDASGRIDLGRAPLTATPLDRDRVALTGTSAHVLAGADADMLLCHAGIDGAGSGLYLVAGDASGLTRQVIPSLDTGLRQARLNFQDVPAVAVGSTATTSAALTAAVNVATVLVAADQVGVGQTALDGAVAYARTRIQFGRHIGSFQAVRHRCADMYLALENARSCAYHALWAIADDQDDHDLAASLAQFVCSQSARRITADAIQVFGGIGFTWEHPAHRHFKRAASNAALLGGVGWHRERLTQRALHPHALAVRW